MNKNDQHFRILTINPGSTSTKIAIYVDDTEERKEIIFHSSEELSRFKNVIEQQSFRLKFIHEFLSLSSELDAVVGRGGLLKPVKSGTYGITQKMLDDLTSCKYGEHASNLGALLAYEVAQSRDLPAYIVDPVVVDEMEDVARYSGIPEIERRSLFHALNQKAMAKSVAKLIGKPYHELNLIVVHMGGGISIGCHKKGRVVDVNNALDGEGPFTPERAGSVPAIPLIELSCSDDWPQDQLKKRITGNGGLVAYLGTNDLRIVRDRINQNDDRAKDIYDAMIYQICKSIGAGAAVLKGKIQGIILTGGMVHDDQLVMDIKSYVQWIAPVFVKPGENEMSALAEGALRVLRREETAKEY